jgi:hypothetical protein
MSHGEDDLKHRYEASSFNEHRLREYAQKVATELHSRNLGTRGPEPPRRVVETISQGFLGLGRKEVEHWEDFSTPRFWIVTVHRGNGGKRWRTRTTASHTGITDGIMDGYAIVLLTDGSLCVASWGWLGSPDRAEFTEIRVADSSMLMSYDRVDRGKWHDVRTNSNEVERKLFNARVGLGVHAKGMGVSQALKRLLEGRSDGSDTMLQ